MMIRPLLLLEINEVPWRLVDRFKADSRYPALGRFFRESRTLTNVAVDTGELSPWITWPTFHRGMPKEEHGIRYLGQDPASFLGTPIWEEYRNRGYSIGVLGSMQSWPPIMPGPGGFYLPDTFAHDSSCIPESLEPVQRFNLQQTASNGRVVNRSLELSRNTVSLVKQLARLGLRPSTIVSAGAQILGERFDETRVSRRPIFQGILFWEVFRKLFDCNRPPAFTSFFTNHVAGIMHRYWRDVFPEDFADDEVRQRPYLSTMEFAIKVVDRILSEVMDYCKRNPELIVVFATSMGQSAIHRDYHEGIEMALTDVSKLIERLGFEPDCCRQLLAMVPQVAVEIEDARLRKELVRSLASCKSVSGAPLFRVDVIGNSLSITLIVPKRKEIDAGFFITGESPRSWKEAGISVYNIDAGTGYHVPEGAMTIYGSGITASDTRECLPTDQAKEFLMTLGGLH